VILSGKALLAAGLLIWVVARVHWRDYAQLRAGGGTCTVLAALPTAEAPQRLRVRFGPPWSRRVELRGVTEFEPMPSSRQVIRPGFVTSLREIHVPLAGLAAMGFGVSLLLVAVRWRLLLRIQEIPISLWEAVRLTFLGQFFNAVVPGTVGGDLVKAYYAAKHTPRKAAALVSVFVDRLLGLVELALMAAVMLGVMLAGDPAGWAEYRLPAVSVAVILVVVSGLLLFLLSAAFRRALRLERLYRRLPIAHHIAAAGHAARLYRRHLGCLVKAVGISFVAHLAFVGFIALTGRSLSIQTPWYTYFLYVPLIYIIGAVPLTPGGVGWIENWYVEFFRASPSGVSTILVLALLARLVPILWGLPGVIVAVTGVRLPGAESMQAELAAGDGAGE